MSEANTRSTDISGGTSPDPRPGGGEDNHDSVGSEPWSATGTGLFAAALGALITSLPQLIEQLSPWNRAFLALIALSLGLSVFGTVQARRAVPTRRRLWFTVSLAGGAVSVCTALALTASALVGAVATSHAKVGFDDDFTLRSEADEDVRVIALPLDAGSYVIWAKLYVEAPETSGVRVTCRLVAENDYDITSADMASDGGSAALSMGVAHPFRNPSAVTLLCRHAPGQPRTSTLRQVKILATSTDSVRIEDLSG
jgi:hypothetical protein